MSYFFDEVKFAKATEKDVQTGLFAHIFFLENVEEKQPSKPNSMHADSREIIRNQIGIAFFKNEDKIVVLDPDGKKYEYKIEYLRNLIKPKTESKEDI